MAGDKVMDQQKKSENVDGYISGFPEDVQKIMNEIRAAIHEAAPGATEKISYQMPGFVLKGKTLVWFGGHTHHIGFYPTGEGIAAFQDELGGYKTSKGAIQFPLDQPMPLDLIRKIVKYRATGEK
jgi:uncharacterized protein YdhG (YjbR/CyaY superfamily)